ncbi:MAG: leucine-rich repeat protein [Oscillospiraceae bacterium]|nr:leucine-rich repeat protein [Oscillospiraceae bacterium]
MENRNHVLKRVLACVMVVVMAVTAVPMSGFVGLELGVRASSTWINDEFTDGYYTYCYYSTKGNGYQDATMITSCDKSVSGDIVIPDSLGNCPVTCIGPDAFKLCRNLSSVTIPESVKDIGSCAFHTCTSLKSVTMPNSVTYIDDYAFYFCTSLTNITIPDSVTDIGKDVFYNCTSLKCVTIPDSVTGIGEYSFSNCTNLKCVTIPNSVTELGGGAFSRCDSLTNLTIGDGVQTIKGYDSSNGYLGTFQNCPNLTKIKIGKNVKTIEENAFKGMKNIPEIYYAGSEAEWKKIAIDSSNDMILQAKIHFNTDVTEVHSYNETLTKPAACTEPGIKTFTCECCEKTYTEEIPAIGHTPSDWIIDSEATCMSAGSKHKECTVCKTMLDNRTIPATGHSFANEVTDATCTSIGCEVKTCKNCGECHFVRVIPNKGHTLETDITPATDSESGLSITSCKTCGTITKATLIKRIASVTLSATKYTYNGKTQTPTVTVKDSAGNVLKKNTDYTVSYASGRKNPGKYAVKVAFKGNYSGTKTLYFTIAPATPTLSVAAGSKKATLKWSKRAEATGYVVYMATSQNGKYTKIATIKNNGTVSMTKTGLTTGKTYYFKVASYKTVSGKVVYSAWSSVKGVKIK